MANDLIHDIGLNIEPPTSRLQPPGRLLLAAAIHHFDTTVQHSDYKPAGIQRQHNRYSDLVYTGNNIYSMPLLSACSDEHYQQRQTSSALITF